MSINRGESDARRDPQMEDHPMKVRDTMTQNVAIARPDHTIAAAALLMAEHDFGALPVGDNDRLVGMITDRDIALRAVAQGLGPDTPVHAVMTPDVKYCFEDEDTAHVAKNMGDQHFGDDARRIDPLDLKVLGHPGQQTPRGPDFGCGVSLGRWHLAIVEPAVGSLDPIAAQATMSAPCQGRP